MGGVRIFVNLRRGCGVVTVSERGCGWGDFAMPRGLKILDRAEQYRTSGTEAFAKVLDEKQVETVKRGEELVTKYEM